MVSKGSAMRSWKQVSFTSITVLTVTVIAACTQVGNQNFQGSPSHLLLPPGETSIAQPGAGGWRTWVLSSPEQVEVPPPPPPGTPSARSDIASLRKWMARRTPQAEQQVRFWNSYPEIGAWIQEGIEAVSEMSPEGPPYASRAYALLSVAMYDATVTAWHWKYVYNRQPPRVAGQLIDPGPEPSYPSEQAAVAGAAAAVLSYLYPQATAGGGFEALATQAATSRLIAGASYPSDVYQGLALGRTVGSKIVAYAERDGS